MTSTHDATTAAALAHAVRRWEAEVENARRLSNRENGILGVIAMLLGLGLFRGLEVQTPEPGLLSWIARALLAASLLQVLAALGLVLWIPDPERSRSVDARARRVFSSSLLRWPPSPRMMQGVVLDEGEANGMAATVTTEAAGDLLRRNVNRKRTLDVSQRFLFGAAICTGLAMLCYLGIQPTRGA